MLIWPSLPTNLPDMPELKFTITGDDKPLQKTFDNVNKSAARHGAKIAKIFEDAQKSNAKGVEEEEKKRKKVTQALQDQSKATDKVVAAADKETAAHERTADAIKKKNAAFDANGRQIRPVQMSSTLDEVNKYNEGRTGTIPGGTVVGASEEFNKMANAANTYGESVRKANAEAAASQKALSTRLKETEIDMARLNNAGRKGYDELGNKIANTIGKQEQLNNKLKMYQEALGKAIAPQSFVNLNKKIEETEAQLNRLKNAGRTGFDELGNKIDNVKSKGNGFLQTLGNIGGALGVAYSVYELISFAKELFGISREASGIERAFSRMGDSDSLAKLRKETSGFVSDLQLEKLTVKANNFNIPIDKLGTFLSFATIRAKETGASVDQLTNNIIDGLGRKSPLIIDNLGISIVEIRKEVSRTGDFVQAVSNIIEREMGASGAAVDTLADKTNRLSTMWDNAKASVAGFFSKIANPGVADNSVIAKMTTDAQKGFGDLSKMSADELAKLVSNQEKVVSSLSGSYKKVLDEYDGAFSTRGKRKIDDDRKAYGEQLAAAQNVLRNLKDQRIEREKTERVDKNILSMAEMEQKVSDLRDKAKNIIPGVSGSADDRKKLLDQADQVQKQIDQITGKAEAAEARASEKARLSAERLSAADAAALSAQERLQQRMQEVKDKFQRQGLSKEQEARKAIIDEFTKLAFDIEQQGKKYDAYAKKYGSARALSVLGPKQTIQDLEPVKAAAMNDLIYRQDTAKYELALDKQREAYEAYENWKRSFGVESARQRFGEELDLSTTYLDKVKARYAQLAGKMAINKLYGGTLSGPEADEMELYSKRLEEGNKAVRAKRDADYTEAYQAAITFNQKVQKINDDYRKIAADLGATITDAQKIELNQQRDNAINSAKDEALSKTAIYKKLAEEAIQITRVQAQEQLRALDSLLKADTLPEDVKTRIQQQIENLKFTLKIGVDQSNLNNLKQEYQDTLAQLNATDENGDSIVSEEAKKRILKRLLEIESKIKSIDGNGDGVASWGDKVAANFEYFKGTTAEVAAGVSNDLGQISGSFNELSNALGGSDTQAGYLLGTIGELAKVGQDAAGAVASFASGDIVGGVTKTVSAVAGLFSIGKKVKEMNAAARKEVQDFYDAAIKGEMEYQALLRKREIDTAARGKNSYRAIIDQLEALKKQSPEVQKAYDKIFSSLQGEEYKTGTGYKHGTWFRKAKTWDIMASLSGSDYDDLEKLDAKGQLTGDAKTNFDSLKALREELDAAGISAEDLQNDLRQLLTGTSTSGLADGLASLFENGKRSAQDFGDSFEEIMKNSIMNTFKAKYLEDALQPFYEELSGLMEGGVPTEDQIAALKNKYVKIGEDADAYLKVIEEATGSDERCSTDGNNPRAAEFFKKHNTI
jgi:DNA repair exonuclease SbcCD ATPase subunit